MRHRLLGLGCALAWLTPLGCTGSIDGTLGAPTGSGGTGAGAAAGAGPGALPADCAKASAPVLHARLLTPSQYDHSVEDLLKVADHPAKAFGGGVSARLDEVEVERRANTAAEVAAKAVATLGAWAPCNPATVDAAACGAQLVEKLGKAALRHSLSELERTQLTALFSAGLKEKDFATGVDWLLTGLLQTPDFLYQFARPTPGEVAGGVVPLESYELASRLSFFVWDSGPDEALLTAAAAGKLQDPAAFDAELARLLSEPRFERGVESFYSSWLGLEGFREVARDDAGLTTEVLASLERSLLQGVRAVYASATPQLERVLSGQTFYFDDKLRAFYGLAAAGPELSPAELPNEGRHGLLTHPALMTLLARPDASNPIARGLFLQRSVLCHEVPPPPEGVAIPPLAPLAENISTRQRLEQHTTEALCNSCHSQIDPPGFALENYDQVGRFRTLDGGQPVDTSGVMASGGDTDGAFASGGELLDRIAHSADVKRCFARHYMTHAVARELSTEDACALSRVGESFVQTGDLKQLLAAVVKSDAFTLRATEDQGAKP